MLSLAVLFWMFIVLFAIIGSMRGWAKEILVSFSVILALALIAVLENLVPVIKDVLKNGTIRFWVEEIIVIIMVFFGYQTPKLASFSGRAGKREQIQDVLLGLILGAISGYLIVGSLWYFMHWGAYPIPYISAPKPGDPYFGATEMLLKYLPPTWLGKPPNIYIAVVLAFIFVIVVFI